MCRHLSYSLGVKLHCASSWSKLMEAVSGLLSSRFSVLLEGGLGNPPRQPELALLKHVHVWFLLCICTSVNFLYNLGCVCGSGS